MGAAGEEKGRKEGTVKTIPLLKERREKRKSSGKENTTAETFGKGDTEQAKIYKKVLTRMHKTVSVYTPLLGCAQGHCESISTEEVHGMQTQQISELWLLTRPKCASAKAGR